jgi:hypothetical protein
VEEPGDRKLFVAAALEHERGDTELSRCDT